MDRGFRRANAPARLSPWTWRNRDLAHAISGFTRRDDGYDVTDYYNVDPCYGTLGDFVEFAHGAKQRGIRVLIDLVVNHTSNEHPWFQQARRDPTCKYRDWYVWSKKRPPNANQGMVFPGVRISTWSYDKMPRLITSIVSTISSRT